MNATADMFQAPPAIPPAPVGFDLIVFGEPAPQGSKRFVGFSKPTPEAPKGRAILVESSDKVKPWRQDVIYAAKELGLKAPLEGALTVRMVFTLQKPASAPKRRKTWPATKPDLSKLARSTEDALVIAGVIRDDSRIAEYLRLAKVYPLEDPEALESPGVRIQIRMLGV